jgi:hypothetical protein
VGRQIDSRLLEQNLRADVREGWAPPRHHIAVPEPVFVRAMRTVARERFGSELDQLAAPTRAAIEEEISDPIHWSVQSSYHAQGCPACSEPSSSHGPTTR